MIVLTVALPMYRAQYIGWVALESLVRQVGVNFEWELIVVEEQVPNPFGEVQLDTYKERLQKVGCTNIKYVPLKQWIPLPQKWRMIAGLTVPTSQMYLLQAADCYSQPHRLIETYTLFKQGADWVQSKLGVFYDVPSERSILFSWDAYKGLHPCGLNMSTKTSFVRKLPLSTLPRGVDMWFFNCCSKIKGSPLKVVWNPSENWKKGLDTHGLNNISRRNFSTKLIRPFVKNYVNVSQYIPKDVIQKLKECKPFGRVL